MTSYATALSASNQLSRVWTVLQDNRILGGVSDINMRFASNEALVMYYIMFVFDTHLMGRCIYIPIHSISGILQATVNSTQQSTRRNVRYNDCTGLSQQAAQPPSHVASLTGHSLHVQLGNST